MLCQYFASRLSDGRHPNERRHCEIVSSQGEAFRATAVQLLYVPPERRLRKFFSPDYLFICYVSELPEDPANAPEQCVCLADQELPPQYRNPEYGKTLFLLESTGASEEPLQMLEMISYILSEDIRYYFGKDMLLSAEEEQVGLHQAMLLIEDVFKNPVMLLAESGLVMDYSTKYQFNDEDVRQALIDGAIDASLLKRIHSLSMHEDFITRFTETYHRGSMPASTLYLRLSIRVNSIRVATLVIGKDNTQFLYSAIQLVKLVQELLSQILTRIMMEQNQHAMLHNLLFSELLTEDGSKRSHLRQQIQQMQWRQTNGMQLLFCVPDHEESEKNKLDQTFADFRQAFPNCRWRIQDGTLILLCYPEDRMEPETLAALLHKYQLHAGVSWPLDDLMHLRYALVQAQTAIEMGHGVLNTYSSCFCVDIYQRSREEWPQYLHPAVVKIAEYDQIKNTDLLVTLAHYLLGSQVQDVTAALHIHRSTLFYRLDQMREIAPELILDSGEERLNLLLSIKFLRIMIQADLTGE